MKRELGWFRIGSGLVFSLLFLMVIPGCKKALMEVTVHAQCGPEAMRDIDTPPTGQWTCPTKKPGGGCIKVGDCSCP